MTSLEGLQTGKLRKTEPMQDSNKENQDNQYVNEFQEYNQDQNAGQRKQKSNSYVIKPAKKQTKNQLSTNKKSKANLISCQGISLHELRAIYKQRSHQITSLKLAIFQKMNKIRDVQARIDKQVINQIMKKGRKNTTIREIFNQNEGIKVDNQKINELSTQLESLRKNVKEEKQKIKKLNEELNDPICRKNNEQALALQNNMTAKQVKIKSASNQKDTLSSEVERMYRYLPEQYVESMHQQQRTLKESLSKIIRQLNLKKTAIYQTEKLDVLLTQKGKFLQEMISLIDETKRQENLKNLKDNNQIHTQIKVLSEQIFKLYQQRLQIQAKRGAVFQRVQNDYQLELKRNEQILKQIRNVDVYFMEKTLIKRDNERRAEIVKTQKIQQKMVQEKSKLSKQRNQHFPRSIPKRRLSPRIDSEPKSPKQIRQDIELSDSRQKSQKSQQFENSCIVMLTEIDKDKVELKQNAFNVSAQGKQIILGNFNQSDGVFQMKDQIFNKSTLEALSFIMNDEFVFGMHGVYFDKNEKIKGCKMISKVLPKDIYKRSLQIGQNQQLSRAKIGYNEHGMIVYMRMQASGEKFIQWGIEQKIRKIEQEIIPAYRNIQLRASLSHTVPETAANGICLVGIGFKINH